MDPAPSDSSLPVRIGGYRVLRRLATGGTSDVLLARAEGPHGFERVVVLKLLLQQFREDEKFERMFAREAAAYARLSHPAIVKLYDFFADGEQLVIVLEYVDGLPLHKFRALLRPQGRTLDDAASMFVAWRIFGALSAAHSAKDPQSGDFSPVIHRDVNPSNVLIPWDGHVKIADFGIAKLAGVDGETQAGLIKGTYGYMAPEQVRGEPLTIRADVYAACLLLWELLTGRKAIVRHGRASDMDVLRSMAEPSFPSLDALRPDLPRPLLDAVARGLEPNPDKRAIYADELCNALRASTNLELGRQSLVDLLTGVRPPAEFDDLAITVSRPPTNDSPDDTLTDPVRRIAPAAPPQASQPPAPVVVHSQPVQAPRPRTPPPPRAVTLKGTPPPAPAVPVLPTATPAPKMAVTLAMPGRPMQPSHATAPSPPSAAAPPTPPPPAPPSPQRTPTPPPQVARTPAPPPPAPSVAAPAHGAPPSRPPAPAADPPYVPTIPAQPPPPPPLPPTPLVPAAGAWTPAPPAPALWTPPPAAPAPMNPAPVVLADEVEIPKRRALGWVTAILVVIGMLVFCGVVVVLWPRSHAAPREARATAATAMPAAIASPSPSPSQSPSPSPSPNPTPTPSLGPTGAASAMATPSPSADSPAPSGTTGQITVPASRGGHRVWVDGHIVGESPLSYTASCGLHKVRVGSQGIERSIQVPCGGETEAR